MTATSVLNRVVSALLAIALLFGALLAVIEIVLAAIGRQRWLVPHPEWSDWLAGRSWSDPVTYAVLVGLVVLGLLLLLLALWRGKPAMLTLPSQTQEVRVEASRRSVEKSLASAASRVTGVTGATASASRRTVRVIAQTATRSQPQLQQQIAAAVSGRLQSIGLDQMRHRVRVKARNTR